MGATSRRFLGRQVATTKLGPSPQVSILHLNGLVFLDHSTLFFYVPFAGKEVDLVEENVQCKTKLIQWIKGRLRRDLVIKHCSLTPTNSALSPCFSKENPILMRINSLLHSVTVWCGKRDLIFQLAYLISRSSVSYFQAVDI